MISHVAQELGVGEQLLGLWVALERARADDPPGALDTDERAELDGCGWRTGVCSLRTLTGVGVRFSSGGLRSYRPH